ncbi:class I SAM-dependent methyltransferase [Streptomyces albofaciens JCM 4342]|uniref:class I SAM-dependent methyltransferase n=1 Tax=Streptomyces albofaciens TaxID=66866 RepID=UPI00123A13B5|nr:class I SAM-dependent methyltransferase [Streptomyces albofaciens]KAA6222779.1 class I SAM-dependent methyltransferase [Streptomyces albofaciens JCM 4342]
MADPSLARFFDQLAATYDLLYPDWPAAVTQQGRALDAQVRDALGDRPHTVLDCACGIGTQAIGLAAAGHAVMGTDLSPVAAARAVAEAAARGLRLPAAAADMRRLPFHDARFDAVVCADNSLAHLTTPDDVRPALAEMRRVLRPGGQLLLGMRAYEDARRERPEALPARVTRLPDGGRAVTLQLWEWHEDGEHYDFDLIQLLPRGGTWEVRSRRTTSWALTREQVSGFVTAAGFERLAWHEPADSGYFQPLLTARC